MFFICVYLAVYMCTNACFWRPKEGIRFLWNWMLGNQGPVLYKSRTYSQLLRCLSGPHLELLTTCICLFSQRQEKPRVQIFYCGLLRKEDRIQQKQQTVLVVQQFSTCGFSTPRRPSGNTDIYTVMQNSSKVTVMK